MRRSVLAFLLVFSSSCPSAFAQFSADSIASMPAISDSAAQAWKAGLDPNDRRKGWDARRRKDHSSPSAVQRTEHRAAFFSAGASSSGKMSFSLGARGPRYGLELGFVDDAELQESEVIDTGIPHSDYTDLGKKRIGPTAGFDFLFFADRFPSVAFFAGPGLYVTKTEHVVQSNVTGWIWKQEEPSSTFTPAVQAGFQAYPGLGLTIGAGYHTTRGAAGQIGLTF